MASPGDVGNERDIAVEVVNRLNKSIGTRLGWHIDLNRWEDQRPGYGRPQSILNPAVDACDLFIGLLWERWGQPTGTYGSGFQEEFERAVARRQSTGEPEIWLVFKKPRSDKLEDPGSELNKVLQFRDDQMSRREVLFREIENAEDWKANLYNWLFEHIFDSMTLVEASQEPPTEAPPTVQTPEPAPADIGGQRTPDIPQQLVELSTKLSNVISSADLEFSRSHTSPLDDFDLARLYLLIDTWMTRLYTAEFLGTHQINLLYKHRDRLEPTSMEAFQLLRTLLHDPADVIPGWFWFRKSFPDGPLTALIFFASEDPNIQLRIRALKMLTSAHIELPKEQWRSLPFGDESDLVSAEAFKYLGEMGDESALAVIDQFAHGRDSFVSLAIREAKLRLLSRLDPNQAFLELLSDDQRVSSDLIDMFGELAQALSDENLIKGTEKSAKNIRQFSVKELTRRRHLTLEVAERLRDDPSVEVRQLAVQQIVNTVGETEIRKLRESAKPDAWPLLSGFAALDVDGIEFEFYRTIEAAKLLNKIGWLAADGPVAYKVLAADHFDILSDVIRTDLQNGFKRVRDQLLAEVRSESGSEAAERFSQSLSEKVDDFISSQFTEAALYGLARHPQPSDAEIARKYLDDKNRKIQLAAAEIISKVGAEQDVQSLLDISRGAWGGLEELGPKTAIRLSRNPESLAIKLARSGNDIERKIALRWLNDKDTTEIRIYFRGLLDDEDEPRRAVALHYLSARLNEEELKQLLDESLTKQSYYYNVVAWLDRLLYAPQLLKEMFNRDLKQEAYRYLAE